MNLVILSAYCVLLDYWTYETSLCLWTNKTPINVHITKRLSYTKENFQKHFLVHTYLLWIYIEREISESTLTKIIYLNFIDITNLKVSDNKFRSNSFLRISRIQLLSADVGNMYALNAKVLFTVRYTKRQITALIFWPLQKQ